MFQYIFNDIKKFSIQWVLTFKIAPWKFESPSGFQFPKWELTWECEGSFLHTLLHSREHEMWFPGFLLDPRLRKPLPWSRAQGWGYDKINTKIWFHSLRYWNISVFSFSFDSFSITCAQNTITRHQWSFLIPSMLISHYRQHVYIALQNVHVIFNKLFHLVRVLHLFHTSYLVHLHHESIYGRRLFFCLRFYLLLLIVIL